MGELKTNTKVKGHATSVMYALSAIVDNLNNNDVLINLLIRNGEAHNKHGVPPRAYWVSLL